MQRLELDHGIFERYHQEYGVALVLEQKILAVAARQRPAQAPRLLDGEQRRVRHGRVRDAEPVEEGEKIVGGGRHGTKVTGWTYAVLKH